MENPDFPLSVRQRSRAGGPVPMMEGTDFRTGSAVAETEIRKMKFVCSGFRIFLFPRPGKPDG